MLILPKLLREGLKDMKLVISKAHPPAHRLAGKSDSRGFALKELLSVLAVLMLLFCVRLPALTGNRQTFIAQCAVNLRQYALAAQLYALDHANSLPATSGTIGNWPCD